ncbi:hypothetical protein [Winogradskyella pulchriflava]|uniref:Uncharacterized protein n=1 Tax=Winogradskyella pulchriflava TaxID=1110688 RepID=A0ABV6QA39_9FLAO
MKVLKLLGHISIAILLTFLTQVGGIIWILSVLISVRTNKNKRYIFPLLYLTFNLLLIPPIASLLGRTQLPWSNSNIASRNWFYPLAFRNYVKPELKNLLIESSKTSGIKITYLDANFPFFDGFPLLPHLSHNDGKKIDISFNYTTKDDAKTDKKPSLSGYGSYVNPSPITSKNCINKGYWQYDFPKNLTFGVVNKDLKLDRKSTRKLLKTFIAHADTQKIFIEPYLKQSLNLEKESKLRFHGCQAVRHDDHIHLQIH